MTGRPIQGPLRRNAANLRYFTDDSGEGVYLTGSHTWNNLADMGKSDPPPAFDFGHYLDVLEANGHNFIRLWAWDMLSTWDARDRVAPFPWPRTGPGLAVDEKPKFDLLKPNPEYFERLRDRLRQAYERGVYVSIMLFEGWAIVESNRTRLRDHLFAKENNINGFDLLASSGDGILRDWVTLDNPEVVAAQEAYVREVVETANPFDNVLYEICNEAGRYSHDWQEHFIHFIRGCEAGKPARHPVGTTGGMGTSNLRTFASTADWVSPDSGASDGKDLLYRTGGHTWGEAPFDNGDKVVLLDTDHLWGIGGNADWAWRSFCRGYNVLYMDRCDDFPTAFFEHEWWKEKFDPVLRREMGKIRGYAERMDLNAATPRNDLASTGYCLADAGKQYIIYQPEGGEFTAQLEPGEYEIEWHNPATGSAGAKETAFAKEGSTDFAAPFGGPAALFVVRVPG